MYKPSGSGWRGGSVPRHLPQRSRPLRAQGVDVSFLVEGCYIVILRAFFKPSRRVHPSIPFLCGPNTAHTGRLGGASHVRFGRRETRLKSELYCLSA